MLPIVDLVANLEKHLWVIVGYVRVPKARQIESRSAKFASHFMPESS